MVSKRLPHNDPRTVARDIPGLFDALFPQLAQGVVASLNRRCIAIAQCEAVSLDLVSASKIQRAMLFEVAVAVAEQFINGSDVVDWEACLALAVRRQRQHFDAEIPSVLSDADKNVSVRVATNLVTMLRHLQAEAAGEVLVRSPRIPGYQWIASGVGDFSVGTTIVEVKCTSKHFSSSDYRQIIMYWLLSYAAAVESRMPEWSEGVLVNPRLNLLVKFSFGELVRIIGAGKSKVELLEVFSATVGDRASRAMG
jgi:hypothetical protein